MADGSITFSVNLDAKEAQGEMTRLKKKIMELEAELQTSGGKKSALEEQLKQAAKLADEAKARAEALKQAGADRSLIKEADALAAEANKEFKAADEAMKKYNAKLADTERELEKQKLLYGEVARSIELGAEAQRQMERDAAHSETEAAFSALTQTANDFTQTMEEAAKHVDEVAKSAEELPQAIEETPDLVEELNENLEETPGHVKEGTTALEKFEERIVGLAKRVFVFSLITTGLRQLRTWMWNVIKTDDQAVTAIAQLKGALLTLAQPLVQVVIPAFTALVNVLTQVVLAIARVVTAIFGTTVEEASSSAEALYQEQQAITAVGSAAKKAERQLASFDEINKLGDSSYGGGGSSDSSIAPDFSAVYGLPQMLEGLLADLSIKIGELKFSWDKGEILQNQDAWIVALTGLLGAVIGTSFGGLTGGVIGLLLGAGVGLIACTFLDKLKEKARAKNSFIVALSAILGGVLGTMFGGLPGGALGLVLGATLGMTALKFINSGENDDGATKISFLDVLNDILRAVLGDEFGGLSGTGVSVLKDGLISFISMKFKQATSGDWDSGNTATAVLGAILGGILGGMFGGLPGAIVGFLLGGLISIISMEFNQGESGDWDSGDTHSVVLSGILGAILGGVFGGLPGAAIGFLLGGVISIVSMEFEQDEAGDWDSNDTFTVVLSGILGAILGGKFGGLPGAAVGLLLGLSISFINAAFIDDLLSEAEASKSFKIALYAIIGALIGSIFGLGVFGGIVGALIGLTLGVDVTLETAKITDNTGLSKGTQSRSNIEKITAAQSVRTQQFTDSISRLDIPQLATGAVIPPNREFMAVLGDQSSGNNLEAPEGLLRQIVREEGGGGNAEIVQLLQRLYEAVKEGKVMVVNDQVFARVVHEANAQETSRRGVPLVSVG